MERLTQYDEVRKCFVIKPDAEQGKIIQVLGLLENMACFVQHCRDNIGKMNVNDELCAFYMLLGDKKMADFQAKNGRFFKEVEE